MRPLLVLGPDSTLWDVASIAAAKWPDRKIESLLIPSRDYYFFDLSALEKFSADEWEVSVVVNEFYINDVRRALVNQISVLGYGFCSVVSPAAIVGAKARIGGNTIVYPGCFIGEATVVGDFCVLRPNVVISENVTVGDYVTLEAGVAIRELSCVGDFVTIGPNSVLLRGAEIGAHSYLNIPRQYSGVINPGTFYSPTFENPVRIFGF